MIVVFGLPWSSNTIMRGEIDSTFMRLSLALGDKRNPTPLTDEFELFLVAEDVTS